MEISFLVFKLEVLAIFQAKGKVPTREEETVELFPGQGSPRNIPQLDGAGSFIFEQGLDVRASDPPVSDFAPLVHC